MMDEPLYLRMLNRAIDADPAAAVNYVLRGEYWLQHGNSNAAITDFKSAIVCSRADLEKSDWGYLEQALIDRATHGLRLARKGVML